MSGFIHIPPGETIKKLMVTHNVTLTDLAGQMKMPDIAVASLLDGTLRLTKDIAVKLEDVFGVPQSFWNNLEEDYRRDLRLANSKKVKR